MASRKSAQSAIVNLPRSLDSWLLILTLLLSALGLFFILEVSGAESFSLVGHQYYFFRQQALALGVGLVAMVVGRLLPTSFWQRTAPLWFGLGLVLLVIVLIPGLGVELNGARRWFAFQGRIFQPVELFKFALVAFSSWWMAREPRTSTLLIFTTIFSILLLLQPDMGSLLILLWISIGMFFLAGGRLIAIGGMGLLGGLMLLLLVLISPYRFERVTTFFNPSADPLGSGFHVRQITLALANGGWFGTGIGNSQQKYAYIPEASSDSIFAIVAEELGFVGAILILLIIMAHLALLYLMATRLEERSFAQLFVLGTFLWLAGQSLLNLASIVVLLPLTGLPLPFFSSGGTSLIMTLLVLGVCIRLYREQLLPATASRRKKVQ